MIRNQNEFAVTRARVEYFQQQIEQIRKVERDPENYRSSTGAYLAEIDKLNREIREYLSVHPSEFDNQAA